MSRKLPRIDRSKVRTTSARRRTSKVALADEARPHRAGDGFAAFLDGLPDVLGAADLKRAIAAGARARARKRTLLWGLGAHVIKVGLAPVLVDLIERGFVQTIEHPDLGEVPILGWAPRFSESSVPIERAPMLGQDTDDVLGAAGLSDDEVAALRARGIVG